LEGCQPQPEKALNRERARVNLQCETGKGKIWSPGYIGGRNPSGTERRKARQGYPEMVLYLAGEGESGGE